MSFKASINVYTLFQKRSKNKLKFYTRLTTEKEKLNQIVDYYPRKANKKEDNFF